METSEDKKAENKKAIVLNYGLLVSDLEGEIREKVDFMRRFFDTGNVYNDTELKNDYDLIDIGQEFGKLLVQLKKLDSTIDSVSKRVLK